MKQLSRKKLLSSVMSALLALLGFTACNGDSMEPESPTLVPSFPSTGISLEQAQADLESLMAYLETNGTRNSDSGIKRKIRDSFSVSVTPSVTRATADSVAIHVFNFEDDNGFAIMSGDVRLPSLLAYSQSGTLSTKVTVTNPGLALFMKGLDLYIQEKLQEVEWLEPIPLNPGIRDYNDPYDVYGNWTTTKYYENGLCPVKWGQRWPYNNYCPPIDGTTLPPAGCVTTGVAQLMAIYRYPSEHDGYDYNWAEMTAYREGYRCSAIGQDNIARLMAQLGQQKYLNVQYGKDGSGADPKNIAHTLDAFGYSGTGSWDKYNTEGIVSELKKGYGVLMCGYSHAYTLNFYGLEFLLGRYEGGHLWLAHGLLVRTQEIKHFNAKGEYEYSRYRSAYYPLCNWGWNGLNDGYYLSEAFDTTEGPAYPEDESSTRTEIDNVGKDYNYQFNITAITGIRK